MENFLNEATWFFCFPEHLSRLSDAGDPLEVLSCCVDFEIFRPILLRGLKYNDGSLGGHPPYDPMPDANTIRVFRERLGQRKTSTKLFKRFDQALSRAGYASRGGQIVDAPSKIAQKDVDARWTVKFRQGKMGMEI